MGEKIGKNKSKNLRSKYSQKHFYHAKQSATDSLKTTSKRVIQEKAEAAGALIVNKIADKIRKVSKYLQKNNSETNTNEHDKCDRYISAEGRQKIIDDLRLI